MYIYIIYIYIYHILNIYYILYIYMLHTRRKWISVLTGLKLPKLTLIAELLSVKCQKWLIILF